MEITRYGQSALLVQEGPTRVLLDPGELSGDSVFELGELAAVCFTHDHPDHCAPERVGELLRRNPSAEIAAPEDVLAQLGAVGNRGVRRLVGGEAFAIGTLSIEAVGSPHALIHARAPRPLNVGFVISNGRSRLFHPGDSYAAIPSGITVLALPVVGPWGSLREAVDFADAVAPKRVLPIHDAHLSESGRALFWPWIRKFSRAATEGLDPEHGTPVRVD